MSEIRFWRHKELANDVVESRASRVRFKKVEVSVLLTASDGTRTGRS